MPRFSSAFGLPENIRGTPFLYTQPSMSINPLVFEIFYGCDAMGVDNKQPGGAEAGVGPARDGVHGVPARTGRAGHDTPPGILPAAPTTDISERKDAAVPDGTPRARPGKRATEQRVLHEAGVAAPAKRIRHIRRFSRGPRGADGPAGRLLSMSTTRAAEGYCNGVAWRVSSLPLGDSEDAPAATATTAEGEADTNYDPLGWYGGGENSPSSYFLPDYLFDQGWSGPV